MARRLGGDRACDKVCRKLCPLCLSTVPFVTSRISVTSRGLQARHSSLLYLSPHAGFCHAMHLSRHAGFTSRAPPLSRHASLSRHAGFTSRTPPLSRHASLSRHAGFRPGTPHSYLSRRTTQWKSKSTKTPKIPEILGEMVRLRFAWIFTSRAGFTSRTRPLYTCHCHVMRMRFVLHSSLFPQKWGRVTLREPHTIVWTIRSGGRDARVTGRDVTGIPVWTKPCINMIRSDFSVVSRKAASYLRYSSCRGSGGHEPIDAWLISPDDGATEATNSSGSTCELQPGGDGYHA